MGIGPNVMEGLIREGQYRPFSGTAYTFGRPTMSLSPMNTNLLFRELGFEPIGGLADRGAIDTITTYSPELKSPPIRDVEFFRMLGFSETKAIDVNGFEGAEILLDLNNDIPSELAGTSDLVVDGSTLDNVFDPVTALRNAARLLKPDGRLCLSNQGNYSVDFTGIPYLIATPIWFYDFFVINRFVDCQVYVTIWDESRSTFALNHDHAARRWDPGLIKPILSEFHVQITVFAERGQDSSWDKVPTQHVYREPNEWETYESVVRSIAGRDRTPHLRSLRTQTAAIVAEPTDSKVRWIGSRPERAATSIIPSGWYHILPNWSIRNPETDRIVRHGQEKQTDCVT